MRKSTTPILILGASAALATLLEAGAAKAQTVGGGGGYVEVSGSGGYITPEEYYPRTSNVLCPGVAPLYNGQCQDASGFSGAALASQALSSLSQSTTQASNNSALGKIRERREQEATACAAGFSRVGGECRRDTPPPREAQRREPTPTRVEKGKRIAAGKGKGKARLAETEPASPPLGKKKGPSAAVRIGAAEPASGPETGGGRWTLFGTPIPITPDSRFGAWVEAYGDFERRTGATPAYVLTGPLVAQPFVPIRVSAQSETSSYGVQMGFDLTTRGVLTPGDGLITGLLIGAAHSDLTLKTQSTSSNFALVDNGSSRLDARFNGGSVGVYATYFDGPLSADFLVKADIFDLSASFTDTIAFAPNFVDGDGNPFYGPARRLFPYASTASTPVIDVSLAGNVNYRFPLLARMWIEPTFGVQYTSTMYDSSGVRLGLADGEQVRLQGGARVGTPFVVHSTPATLTVTGLVYDDVLVAGGFVSTLAFNGANVLAQANEGKPRGRGIVALNFDHGDGISSYIQGEVRGGSGLIGGGGKAGVRFSW
jgi:hypothetical protein